MRLYGKLAAEVLAITVVTFSGVALAFWAMVELLVWCLR